MDSKHTNTEARELRELEQGIERELAALMSLDERAKEQKNADVKEMIHYYHDMTGSIEERRISVHTLSLQLLGISIAGLGALFTNQTDFPPVVFWPVTAVLMTQVLFSLGGLLTYIRQSRFSYYPFKQLQKYGNKWKWFYYGNEEILKISEAVYRVSTRSEDTLEPYLRGLRTLIHGYVVEDIDRELSDNIQLLYLLQVHNYYKNGFYLQLVRIREWSIYVTIVALIAGVIGGWLVR